MPINPGPTLGRLLDSVRRDAGYSLRQLAKETGMPMSRINRLLKDEVERPAPASLVRLAGALNLSVARLFTLAGHPYPNLDDLLRTDYSLSEEEIAEVTQMIDRLAPEGDPDAPTA
jgi:transcriptional regulator with XRE-family HTH domain